MATHKQHIIIDSHPSRACPVYGAIDLGTHNCRMLMAEPCGMGLRVTGSFSRIVRLGEEVRETGQLTDKAMARTVEALKVCGEKLRQAEVRRIRAVATAACRLAGNSGPFLEQVRGEAGIELEIIDAGEEARLTLMGCLPLLKGGVDRGVLVDIGGGSTEISWVELPRRGLPRILDMISLNLGVVTLTEEFGGDTLDDTARQTIADRIRAELIPFDQRHGITDLVTEGRVRMVGTSGTVTTLGALSLNLKYYDRRKVDGLYLSMKRAMELESMLMSMSLKERAKLPAIGGERAELVGVGCAIMQAVGGFWPLSGLTAADRGIREGALIELMAQDGLLERRHPACGVEC